MPISIFLSTTNKTHNPVMKERNDSTLSLTWQNYGYTHYSVPRQNLVCFVIDWSISLWCDAPPIECRRRMNIRRRQWLR
jgi:hypothetical protein